MVCPGKNWLEIKLQNIDRMLSGFVPDRHGLLAQREKVLEELDQYEDPKFVLGKMKEGIESLDAQIEALQARRQSILEEMEKLELWLSQT